MEILKRGIPVNKKILLLGGSESKSIAIAKAKELGYYTILCDYLPDNYGRKVADKFYLESTTDIDAILRVATEEKVDGIVSYASDYGAPAAAYVSEKLGLATNNYNSVMILREKQKFRKFLIEHGFACPKAASFANRDYDNSISSEIRNFNYPLMVKPVDSCGSKGVSKICSPEELINAYTFAKESSLSKGVIIEEFIENDYEYLIGGDVFVQNGDVVCWGLLNCHRDINVNPLVPTGKSYPAKISSEHTELLKSELCRLFSILNIRSGAFNVEVIISNSKPYFIEIGPRNGGNEIPDFLSLLTNSDIIAATIESAMGNDTFPVNQPPLNTYMSTYNIHSSKSGTYIRTEINEEYKNRVLREDYFVKAGTAVKKFDSAGELIGIVFLKHNSEEEMYDMMNNPDKWLNVIVE